MDPEGSLPCSQEPVIGSYPDIDLSSPHFLTFFSTSPTKEFHGAESLLRSL